jgi:hypothetical protein
MQSAAEKSSVSLFQMSYEKKLILLSLVLIALSLMSLRVDMLAKITAISSLQDLEVWIFRLAFSGVGFTVGVLALLIGIVDSRLVEV